MTEKSKYIPEELIPKKGSDGVGPAVAKMLSEIFAYREEEKIPERCNRFYKMKRNKHWKYESDDFPLLSANLCGTHHKKTVNMLTDNNPTFDIVPDCEIDDDTENKLSIQKNTADTWWNDTEQQSVLRESVDSGELYGTVGEFVYLDDRIDFPHGDVSVDTLDLLYNSLYPPECRLQRKAEGFLRWYPMTVREARRKWPESAGQIVGDMSLLDEIGDERKEDHKESQSFSIKQVVISAVTKLISGEKSQGEVTDTDKLFIVEAWVKDYSEDESGEPIYPGNIRRVIVCNCGEVVLADDYNPSLNLDLPEEVLQENYLYDRWPASYIQPVPDPSSPFGLSDFEQLESLNMELNKAMSQFAMFKDGALRLKISNPKDSGVSDDELNNVSGIVRPTNRAVADGIKYIDPPQMGYDIPTSLNIFKDLFNEIAGSFSDVTQGKKAGAEVVAAKAIALLLETEARMARGKGQSYAKMIRERGRMYLALAQMWYEKPRYITFQKEGKRVTEPVTGKALRFPGKLNVVSGSTLPVSDIYKREEALALGKDGWIDQEEVLKKLEIDNYQDIIKRMQEGPLGVFLQKIGLIGVPQELLQIFKQAASMDEKEIEKAVKEGKIPPFMEVLKAILGQQPEPKPDPEELKIQIEARKVEASIQNESKKAEAEVQKTMAEVQEIIAKAQESTLKTELIKEQIITEKVKQQVSMKGIEFDEQKLIMERAETVDKLKTNKQARLVGKVNAVMDAGKKELDHKASEKSSKQGPYNEKGMKSNNKERV